MDATWLLIAFVLGLLAGAMLTALLVLLAGVRATREQQRQLTQARLQLGRPA
jgi:uncharacterized membrane protein YciS (DUF1049 family)